MNYKTAVLMMFSIFVFTGLISGLYLSQVYQVTETDFKAALPVQINQIQEESTNAGKLRAMLKGSIYESGEAVTVFGACFDGYGYLLPGSTATFNSWYPNGTASLTGVPMTSMNGSGRFYITGPMTDVHGTYLTEIVCSYDGDTAVAYGEWQNPDWVIRIKDTQDAVANLTNYSIIQFNNITSNIENFRAETQVNFSQVLSAINGLNVSGLNLSLDAESFDLQFKEIYNQIHALDTSFWVLDTEAPWYSYGSGMFNFKAVDMLSIQDVFAVSDDGYIVYWDGETWQVLGNYSSVEWYGVSVLPASIPYAWAVGSQTSSTSVYSINGGTPTTLAGSTGTAIYDVKIFPDPNSPSSNYLIYLLEDNGDIWVSEDSGANFNNTYTMTSICSPDRARLSQVIYNVDLGVTDGYRVAAVMCNQFTYFNGTNYVSLSADNQTFSDVELVYNNLAYAVSKDGATNELKVWKFDGTSLELVYVADDASIDPKGIAAAATNDIWIVTSDPSVYYHYDGLKWEYYAFQFSGAIGTTIYFDYVGGALNLTSTGLSDVVVFNSKNAYAVGTDGLIMKLYSVRTDEYDRIMASIENMSLSLGEINLSDLNLSNINFTVDLTEIVDMIVGMNQSLMNELNIIQADVIQMNTSMQIGFNNVVQNISYMQLYLNTTIYPMLTLILERLGVIEANVNATLAIVNQTQGTVNQINESVNTLLNQTRPRIRAWITQ